MDAAAAGLPQGVQTDADSLAFDGLLLSFDTDFALSGSQTVAEKNLVSWDGTILVWPPTARPQDSTARWTSTGRFNSFEAVARGIITVNEIHPRLIVEREGLTDASISFSKVVEAQSSKVLKFSTRLG